MKLEIGYAVLEQIKAMFLRFFPSHIQEAEEFVRRVQSSQESRRARGEKADLSMAELQGFFLVHKHSVQSALQQADSIHDSQKQLAVAASFVNTFATSPKQTSAEQALADNIERVVAVPDKPVDPAVVAAIQQRIEAEEAAAAAKAASAKSSNMK